MITNFKIFEQYIDSIIEYKQINTEEFQEWFKGSLLKTSKDDEPIVYWHQTSNENEKSIYLNGFSIEEKYAKARVGDLNVPDGVFFKNSNMDISVGETGDKAVQIPVYLNFKHPFYVDDRQDIEIKL